MKLFDRFLGGPVAEVQTLQCRSAELSARLAAVTAHRLGHGKLACSN